MRFTFPESDESGIVVDAFDRGSRVEIPDDCTVAGYTTRNSGGVPDNFRNWFVVRFDRPFDSFRTFDGTRETKGSTIEGDHALAAVYFATRRGEQVTARVASSFISHEQALWNLETELGDAGLEAVKARRRSAGTRCSAASRSRAAPRSSTVRSTPASTVRRSSPASSTRSTPRATPSITAPTTARCSPATCTPTRGSGTRSAAFSRF